MAKIWNTDNIKCWWPNEATEINYFILGVFPDSSVGKETTFNSEDPGLIPGLGRPPGDGIGYLLQCSWASVAAQLVKNPPAMRETWVWSLGWKDPLETGKATYSSILAWRIPWTVHGVAKSQTWLSDFHFHLMVEIQNGPVISEDSLVVPYNT